MGKQSILAFFLALKTYIFTNSNSAKSYYVKVGKSKIPKENSKR